MGASNCLRSGRALESAIPANLRDAGGQWVTLSLRARVLYAKRSMPLQSSQYQDLADPKWKRKVRIRAGQHPYNTALIAATIAHDGAEKTAQWLRGVKANLARRPPAATATSPATSSAACKRLPCG